MNMGMDNVIYWFKNQAVIVYASRDLSLSKKPQDIARIVTTYREQLNQAVLKGLDYHLEPLKSGGVHPQADASPTGQVDDIYGVYLFNPAGSFTVGVVNPTTAVIFYRIEPNSEGMSMPGAGSMGGNGGMGTNDSMDSTLAVVNELNKHKDALQAFNVLGFDALPHWLEAGTPDGTHGCPVSPPIPFEEHRATGQWKTTFQLAEPSLKDKTGEGVTVFVLDTLPTREQIKAAARSAGNHNMLLQDIVQQIDLGLIKLFNQDVPDPQDSAVTGKDIYGRLAGFPLVDHGLFIAGIIHELAPRATIECIRVLNDFGVGTLQVLINTLQQINNRMSQDNAGKLGDLYGKPVVINLSLVIGPPESDMARLGLDSASVKSNLQGLKTVFLNLAQAGVVFAASASNDSDPRDISMNPTEVRFGPRYPAAFLYDDVPVKSIMPVGAVNRQGKAASYSNHPGPQGMGAYGGELPRPNPWLPSAMSHMITTVDTSRGLDAFRGVYCYPSFPALSMNDPYPGEGPSMGAYPMSPVQNVSAWVYWSGTSFATPVITALAARSLQGYAGPVAEIPAYVRHEIQAAAHQVKGLWTSAEDAKGDRIDLDGYAVMVKQE